MRSEALVPVLDSQAVGNSDCHSIPHDTYIEELRPPVSDGRHADDCVSVADLEAAHVAVTRSAIRLEALAEQLVDEPTTALFSGYVQAAYTLRDALTRASGAGSSNGSFLAAAVSNIVHCTYAWANLHFDWISVVVVGDGDVSAAPRPSNFMLTLFEDIVFLVASEARECRSPDPAVQALLQIEGAVHRLIKRGEILARVATRWPAQMG